MPTLWPGCDRAKTVAADQRRPRSTDVAFLAPRDGRALRRNGRRPLEAGCEERDFAQRFCIRRAYLSSQERSKPKLKTEVHGEPAVRAQEAAARFSDKTAAELLPVSVHAAQAQSSRSEVYN